jgi:hypothetical protein
MTEEQVLIGDPENGGLYGAACLPDDAHINNCLVLCAPIGHEWGNAAQALVQFSRQFASLSNYMVFRYDHYGMGESGGNLEDIQFADLQNGLSAVLDHIQMQYRPHNIRLLATRLGALPAYSFCRDVRVQGIYLFDPVTDTRLYRKELEMMGRFKANTNSTFSVNAGGYIFGGAFLQSLITVPTKDWLTASAIKKIFFSRRGLMSNPAFKHYTGSLAETVPCMQPFWHRHSTQCCPILLSRMAAILQ